VTGAGRGPVEDGGTPGGVIDDEGRADPDGDEPGIKRCWAAAGGREAPGDGGAAPATETGSVRAETVPGPAGLGLALAPSAPPPARDGARADAGTVGGAMAAP